MALRYNPDIFAVRTQDDARRIILTQESEATTAQRWEQETPYLAEIIAQALKPSPDSVLLDYGCGIGRVAKALIDQTGCRVIGVDISNSMRALAADYVASDRFLACDPAMLDELVRRGTRLDGAIAIWVLQHCLVPAEDIARIAAALRPGAGVFVVNNINRAVPTREVVWVNDGIDLRAALAAAFAPVRVGRLDGTRVTQHVADFSFCGSYRRN